MAIDGLSSTAALIAALRTDAARKSGSSQRLHSPASKGTHQAAANARPEMAVLRRELVDMVKGVDPDDAQAVRAIRPQMIKAILLWEFGARVREHTEWRPMMDGIVKTMEADTHEYETFVALIKYLQSHK